MAIGEELIKEINDLANKKKAVGLNEQEVELQKKLRKKYLSEFRNNMKTVLDNTDFLKEFEILKINTSIEEIDKLRKLDGIEKVTTKVNSYMITYNIQKVTPKQILQCLKN